MKIRIMKKFALLLVIIALVFGGFFALVSNRDGGLWVLNNAIKLSSSQSVTANLAFGDQPWQKLDVYPAKNTSPVVVFIHGGSWRHGRKDQYRFAADAFSRLGYTVVVPDYIKHPAEQARFPAHVIDGAKAIAWVKRNIEKHNGDADNIFIAGHSAGAHTVAMLATDGQYLAAVGLSENDIRGLAGIAGPYSFIPDWYVTEAVFGPPENYPLMDALNYVDGKEPASLLLHAVTDQQVGQYNQEKLAKAMTEQNVDVETVLYQDLSHIDMVTHLHPWFAGDKTIAADIDKFFRARVISN